MEQKKKTPKKLGPYMRGKDQVRPLPELGNTLPPPRTSISMVPPPTPSPAQLNQRLSRKVFLEFKSIIVAKVVLEMLASKWMKLSNGGLGPSGPTYPQASSGEKFRADF